MIGIRAHQLTAWLIFLLVLGVFSTLLVFFPLAYVWATYEDLYAEWVQWYLFVAVMLLSAVLGTRSSAHRWFFVLLALAGFYAAGEEISWGQRLIGFDSPEFFSDYNIQEETNLHNFLTGPEHVWTNTLMQIVLAGGLIGYGVLYPLLLRHQWPPARWAQRIGIAAPPLYLWPFFPVAAAFELGLFKFNEQEVAEILVGTALMLMLAHYGVLTAASEPALGTAPLEREQSRRLSGRQILLVIAVVALALGTAQINYRNPDRQPAIYRRVLNGYEKFADRYETLGLWSRACRLYLKAHTARPERTDVLENLVTCLQTVDDPRYRQYAKVLLERTLTRAERGSRNILQQLSVANSYRDIGDDKTADEHLQFALRVATEESEGAPDDPNAAYRMGMVYEVMRDFARARDQYARASTLAPENPQFSAAYKRVGELIGIPPNG